MKILLVDDSRTMRTIQKGILRQLGHTNVEEAVDGLDALSKYGAFQPDLMLVDWNMPNMDGITFVRKVRETGSKTPIIMVTTEAEKSRVIEALKAGVNNYIVKPFTPESFTELINDVISRATAA